MQRSNAEKLARLDHTGLRVVGGKLQNLFGQPSGVARPPHDRPRRSKEEFSRDQSLTVFRLMAASQEEGRKGNKIFQLLESMDPDQSHSWQSYENHFRKGKTPDVPRPPRSYEAAFPNLIESTGTDVLDQPLPQPLADVAGQSMAQLSTSAEATSFGDNRVDIARNIHRMVGVEDKKELEQLLKHRSIARAYEEYYYTVLEGEYARACAGLETGGEVFRTVEGRSHLGWKVDHALKMLESQSSRFLGPNPPKTNWSADDHDVRFIVRLFMDAVTSDHPWTSLASHRRPLCERALWLMMWFRWVHKPCAGTSAESQRVRRNKEFWRTKLAVQLRSTAAPTRPSQITSSETMDGTATEPDSSVAAAATSPGTGAALQQPSEHDQAASAATATTVSAAKAGASHGDSHPSGDRAGTPSRGGENTSAQRAPEPSKARPRAKQEAKAAAWLLEETWQMFKNREVVRLGSWGVDSRHKGTCILVPDEWDNTQPSQLLETPEAQSYPSDKASKRRLQISLRGVSALWARAAAWFKVWPRNGSDLEWCWSVDTDGRSLVHASHLCHQAFCINPNHLLMESASTNINRMQCAHTAAGIRSLGYPVPEFCNMHPDNPCLMQLAALTTAEATNLQFTLLRMALSQPATVAPRRPADHPQSFTTFEYSIPTQMQWPAITFDSAHLVMPPETLNFMVRQAEEKHLVRCVLCPNAQRTWTAITAYWSHLRVLHADQRQKVVAEIRRSAEAYADWADQHFQDLAHHNTPTWIKIQQAATDGFCWEVVQGWRLPQDRLNYGREPRKTAGGVPLD